MRAALADNGSDAERKRQPSLRQPPPADLPRIDNPIAVPESERPCPKCGAERACIGHDVTEVIELVPAQVVVRVDRREKLGCDRCQGELVRAPLGDKVVAARRLGSTLVAALLVDKYDDGLPLHRQKQRFERMGLTLSVSTMADHVADASNLFDQSFKRPELIECGCNMHGRRYFTRALDAKDARAALPLAAYKKLYEIGAKARDRTVDERLLIRESKSRPVWNELCAWWKPPSQAVLFGGRTRMFGIFEFTSGGSTTGTRGSRTLRTHSRFGFSGRDDNPYVALHHLSFLGLEFYVWASKSYSTHFPTHDPSYDEKISRLVMESFVELFGVRRAG